MRILLITGLLLVMPWVAAGAADQASAGCCPASIEAAADNCNKLFTIACVRVLYTPRCDWPEHRCAVPFIPCDRPVCIDPPCHEPVVPSEPCGWELCLDPPCHQTVVSAAPCDPCPGGDPVLTGSRELIAEPCTCVQACSCADNDTD